MKHINNKKEVLEQLFSEVEKDFEENREEKIDNALKGLAFIYQNYSIMIHNLAIKDESFSDILTHFFILSFFKETRAFEYIIKIAQLPERYVIGIMGEASERHLARWLISTYNGDFTLLKKLIENETAYVDSRNAALVTLIGLILLNKLTRQEVIAYIKTLIISDLVYDDEFATILAVMVYNMCAIELSCKIYDLFERKLVNTDVITVKDIDVMVKTGSEEIFYQECRRVGIYAPIDSIKETVQDSLFFEHRNRFNFLHEDVDRNDECRCGSEKKYKHCCLKVKHLHAKKYSYLM